MLAETEKRFAWSASGLSAMQQCGAYWNYSYGSNRDEFSEDERPELQFGRAIHSTLEAIHEHGAWSVIDSLRLWDGIWRVAVDTVDWKQFPGRLKNYEKLGPELILSYIDIEVNQNAEVIAAEWKFEIDFEGFPVRGIIDQIRKLPDDKLLVIDFKTSKEPPEQLILRTDPQLTIYAAAVQQHYGQWPYVALYHLRSSTLYETTRGVFDLAPVADMLREAQFRVDNNLLTRQLGRQCTFCTYKKPCLTQII